jgi:hypothetical protein
MFGGYRGEGRDGGSPTVVAVRLAAEARWHGSTAGRAVLDPRWAMAGGEANKKPRVEGR